MNPSDRYDTSGLSEDQFEPGSGGRVLKNLLGITTREKIETAETAELWLAEGHLLEEIEQDQSFTAQDIRDMHHLWLGNIYTWRGITVRSISVKTALLLPWPIPSRH